MATSGSATLKIPSARLESPDEAVNRQKFGPRVAMNGESHIDGENSIGGIM
jgi:hypothetical protein